MADDHDELRLLYEAEYRSLVRLASFALADRDACEEVVQEAFVKAIRSWGRVADRQRAPAYVRSIVLNEARARGRRARVAAAHRPDPAPASPGPEPGVVDHEVVVAALRTLPPRQQEAIVLRYWLDLSEADIAATLGIAAGSVKTHLHRGVASLARILEERP